MNYVQVLSGLLTPLIAIITTYIAVQQYRTDRAKARHELYERRLKVYNATMRFLMFKGGQAEHIKWNQWHEFNEAIAESPFLFDDDVAVYLEEFSKREEEQIMKQILSGHHGEKKSEADTWDAVRFYQSEKKILTAKFMKYLNLKSLK